MIDIIKWIRDIGKPEGLDDRYNPCIDKKTRKIIDEKIKEFFNKSFSEKKTENKK